MDPATAWMYGLGPRPDRQSQAVPQPEFEQVFPPHRYYYEVWPGPIGYSVDEQCNRQGCKGFIAEHDSDGGCSCHIHPPCSYCTTAREYCPECDWEAEEERRVEDAKRREARDRENAKRFPGMTPTMWEGGTLWQVKRTRKDLDRTKIDYYIEGHTHFSQKVIGVYPPGATREEVFNKVQGSFGGRFTEFEDGNFTFIAYTD